MFRFIGFFMWYLIFFGGDYRYSRFFFQNVQTEAKLKERNKLMISEEVTATCFTVMSLSGATRVTKLISLIFSQVSRRGSRFGYQN